LANAGPDTALTLVIKESPDENLSSLDAVHGDEPNTLIHQVIKGLITEAFTETVSGGSPVLPSYHRLCAFE
jgi:hypothetical protein